MSMKPTAEWEPTPKLRWRYGDIRTGMVLQQQWQRARYEDRPDEDKVIIGFYFEWRDVPTVD